MSAETYPPEVGGGSSGDDRVASPDTQGNIADLVGWAAKRGPEHPAVIDVVDAAPALEVTWAELDAAVTAEAHRLRAQGLAVGDRVALRLPTGAAFCVALFGILRAGCVAVPLPTSSPAAELRRIIDDSGARALVTDGDPFGSEDAPEAAVLPRPEPTPDEGADVTPITSATGGSDIAVLAYTSGTSGPSRGAMLSHGALLANVRQCARLRPMPVNAADRVLLALPLFHAYGLGPGLLQVASVGATAVLLPRFDADSALDAVAQLRVTSVVGVPPMYYAWLKLPSERLREGMSTVRLLTSGAAPLGAEAAAAVRAATGLDVFEGYGLTETGPVLTTTLAGGRAKPGSVGRPLPGVEIQLVDADGEPLVDGEDEGDTGRVAARGPNLFSGYWPDGNHGPDEDGWFRTGDVGYFDADGDLHLVDRATDLIIVNGFNVYPHEVEHALLEMDGVFEAAVVGVPDESSGEAVKAVIVPREGAEVSDEQVLEHCASRLAKFKVPTSVEFASALPHSPTGKLARRVLRG
jgi:long-chain acyl-CoA synthetase